MRILGIDPGLDKTGFSVIDMNAGSFTLITAGVFRVPKGELSSRLSHIFRCIQELAAEYHPDIAACEKVFVNVNPQSTLLLGQARGAAICSAAVAGLPVREFTPTEIKQAVTGSGRAEKPQIQAMMVRIFSLPENPQADAADAMACALTAAQTEAMTALTGAAKTSMGNARFTSRGGAKSSRRAWAARVAEMKGDKP